jgi:site-specific recombinase XerC
VLLAARKPITNQGTTSRSTRALLKAPEAAAEVAVVKPTVKQHLAAIRMLFDWLVTGAILASNPATSVRGPSTSSSAARPPCSPPTRPAS